MDLATKKIRRGITFSKEGEADLVEFHQQVVDSLNSQSEFSCRAT